MKNALTFCFVVTAFVASMAAAQVPAPPVPVATTAPSGAPINLSLELEMDPRFVSDSSLTSEMELAFSRLFSTLEPAVATQVGCVEVLHPRTAAKKYPELAKRGLELDGKYVRPDSADCGGLGKFVLVPHPSWWRDERALTAPNFVSWLVAHELAHALEVEWFPGHPSEAFAEWSIETLLACPKRDFLRGSERMEEARRQKRVVPGFTLGMLVSECRAELLALSQVRPDLLSRGERELAEMFWQALRIEYGAPSAGARQRWQYAADLLQLLQRAHQRARVAGK